MNEAFLHCFARKTNSIGRHCSDTSGSAVPWNLVRQIKAPPEDGLACGAGQAETARAIDEGARRLTQRGSGLRAAADFTSKPDDSGRTPSLHRADCSVEG